MRGMRTVASAVAAGALSIGLAVALVACVPEEPMPVPTVDPSGAPSPGASAPPAEPELVPSGTADDNLLYFRTVISELVEAGGKPRGRDFIDALVAAGFSKTAMELTPDRTTINAEVDQVQFSVRMNGTCLIGQYGGGKLNGVSAPLLATGNCLIGTTRPIDW